MKTKIFVHAFSRICLARTPPRIRTGVCQENMSWEDRCPYITGINTQYCIFTVLNHSMLFASCPVIRGAWQDTVFYIYIYLDNQNVWPRSWITLQDVAILHFFVFTLSCSTYMYVYKQEWIKNVIGPKTKVNQSITILLWCV